MQVSAAGRGVEYPARKRMVVTGTLSNGGRAEIRGFGSFGLNYKPPRNGRNPKNGDKVNVPAKYVQHFRVGKELRERVNV